MILSEGGNKKTDKKNSLEDPILIREDRDTIKIKGEGERERDMSK
jgi:hypothetical protein